MIEFTANVSGSQVASGLMNDDEELAYCLKALAEDATPHRMASDVAGYLTRSEAAEVIAFLRALAGGIEGEYP